MQQAISDAAGNKKTKAKTVAKSNRPYVISVDVKPQQLINSTLHERKTANALSPEPSLISLIDYVDIKHHVYLLYSPEHSRC